MLSPTGYNKLLLSLQFWMFSHPSLPSIYKTHNTKSLISYRKYNSIKEYIKWCALLGYQRETFLSKLSFCSSKRTKDIPNN